MKLGGCPPGWRAPEFAELYVAGQADAAVAPQPRGETIRIGQPAQRVYLRGDCARQSLGELDRLVCGVGNFGHDDVDNSRGQQVRRPDTLGRGEFGGV